MYKFQLTTRQWHAVDKKVKEIIDGIVSGFKFDKNKITIHQHDDGSYEQWLFFGDYDVLENIIIDIISCVLERDEIKMKEDEIKAIAGFQYLMDNVEQLLSTAVSEHLNDDSVFVYFDCGNIMAARFWTDEEDVPKELRHLINKY